MRKTDVNKTHCSFQRLFATADGRMFLRSPEVEVDPHQMPPHFSGVPLGRGAILAWAQWDGADWGARA